MAPMALSDSEVKTCSKTCLKNHETLKKQYDDLRTEFNKSQSNLANYKRGLASVEEQLVFYRKNEVIFGDKIVVLKRDVSFKDSDISWLKSELEKVKLEKESYQLKIENFENASKSLDQLLGSQIIDKSRKGVGFVSYNVVPPPHTGFFSPPKIDLSNSGLEEFQEPEFEGYGPKTSKSASEDISNEVRKSNDAQCCAPNNRLWWSRWKITKINQDPGILLVQHDAKIQGRHEHEPEFDFDADNVPVTTASAEISTASPKKISQVVSTASTKVTTTFSVSYYALIWRNKVEIETISLDDLYNNLKIYEPEITGSSSTSQNSQNVAFVSNSTNNTNSTNKADDTAHGVSTTHTQGNGVNSICLDNLCDAVICAFLASQPNSPQLSQEDLEQLHPDDLEEMDLQWEMAMLTIRARRFIKRTGKKLDINGQRVGFDKSKVECFNCHKHGHFARECRFPRNQEYKGRENNTRTIAVETPTQNALIAQDGIGGYDWSYQAEEEQPTNHALMAFTSSGSSSSSDSEVDSCSKTCVKAYASLKEQYDNLSSDYKKSQFNLVSYKAGLESVEARLAHYKKNEAVFEESINVLKLESLNNILESQVTDKFKTGLGYDAAIAASPVVESFVNLTDKSRSDKGYHSVPPPLTGNFIPRKPDLTFMDEIVKSENLDVTTIVTPSNNKTVENKGVPNTVESNAVRMNNTSAPIIEDWNSDDESEIDYTVRPNTEKIESLKTVREIDAPKQNKQYPRGNQRNWNNLMYQRLRSDFKMTNKACYVCGSFEHLHYVCDKKVERTEWNNSRRVHHKNFTNKMTHPHPKRSFVPQAVLTRSEKLSTAGIAVNTVRPVNTANTKAVNTVRPVNTANTKAINTIRSINTAASKPIVNHPRTKTNAFKRGHSQRANAGYGSLLAGFGSKINRCITTFKKYSYFRCTRQIQVYNGLDPQKSLILLFYVQSNPQQKEYKEKAVIDNGCSRHMTRNKCYLDEFEDYNGGFVSFGRVKLGISRKVINRSLDFDDVYFCKELKYNLFSVSQICDKKNNVLFTDTRCIVLSSDIKLLDESQVIKKEFSVARTPQQNGVAERKNRTLIEAVRTIYTSYALHFEEHLFDPHVPNVSSMDKTGIFGNAYDDEDLEEEVDMNNVISSYSVPDTSFIKFHKDHPEDQVIGREQFHKRFSKIVLFAVFLSQMEPKKPVQALKDPSWVEAMQDELIQFKLLKDERGKVVKNKARLLAQGHTQEEGIDYDEVFAPFARIEAIRLFLAYASFKDFVVYEIDIKSAFLYGKIEEEVYVCQHPSFEDPHFPDKVYKVERLCMDYIRPQEHDDILLVQVYVDDIIFGSTKKEMSTEFEKLMHDKFQMSSMGELSFFSGLQVQQKSDGIFISQDKYMAKILKKFDFASVKTASTPIETNKALIDRLD
ncbi:putative ribonuclease H-like domain-containing protein [Tanacetum coccineum]